MLLCKSQPLILYLKINYKDKQINVIEASGSLYHRPQPKVRDKFLFQHVVVLRFSDYRDINVSVFTLK